MKVEGTQFSGGSVGIALGETESEPIPAHALCQGGFILPAAFEGTSISFKVSHNGVTYVALYDATDTLVAVTVTQGRAYAFPIALFPFPFIKLVSNAAGGEDAAREIQIVSKY
jgi:hypothetical protein